jgi:transposase
MTKPPNLKDLTPDQKDALIMDLVRRLNELEAKLEKDSHNSSKPPSSDDGFRRKPRSLREPGKAKPGAQPGHKGKTLRRIAQPDHVHTHRIKPVCDACGSVIAAQRIELLPERRQVIDLPAIRFAVTEHRVEVARCTCGKLHRAAFPAQLSQAVQYGSQIKAAAVYLTQYQQVPVERASQALYDLFGLRMSAGTVQNCIREAAHALTPAAGQIRQALREAPVVHFDETGMRVGRTLHWLHTAGTHTLSWYGSHRKRGKPALDELGILSGFAGVAVHDGWAPYARYDCEHALCNAHHLRELIYVHERTRQTWAVQMVSLLREACREAGLSAQQGHHALHEARYRHYRQRYDELLAQGKALNPRQARDPTREDLRGRIRQSEAYNLLSRLERFAGQVWRFAIDHRVPFTNNQAERDIRMPKLKQKVSGCFRAAHGLQAFCTIRSYLASLRKQQRSLLEALSQAFAGNAPSPLPC